MKNLINFFFSFDKLMKEKLVIAFFWLALIIAGLNFFSEALSAIKLGPLAAVIEFILFFGSILLTLVTLRLICELAVALFRINDNLSPDGGKSETANIDPIAEARKAAEAAAVRARDLSKLRPLSAKPKRQRQALRKLLKLRPRRNAVAQQGQKTRLPQKQPLPQKSEGVRPGLKTKQRLRRQQALRKNAGLSLAAKPRVMRKGVS